jgi:Tryptophan synthase alpha chain
MTIKKLFEQLKEFRKNISFRLYWWVIWTLFYNMDLRNSVPTQQRWYWWIDSSWSARTWIWNWIRAIIKKHGLDFIFLVTPETSEERIKKLDELSTGFLYAVSSSSTTGSDKNMTDVKSYLQKLRSLNLGKSGTCWLWNKRQNDLWNGLRQCQRSDHWYRIYKSSCRTR